MINTFTKLVHIQIQVQNVAFVCICCTVDTK